LQQGHPAAIQADPRGPLGAALAGVAVVVALGALTRFLEQTIPAAAEGTAFAGFAAAIEFPVYAILLDLLGNVVLTRLHLRDRLAGGFRTEFFIKTGLVLLGASINFAIIVTAAGPAILQALVLISVVFGVHLVARWPARARRPAARTAVVGGVDLRHQRRDSPRRWCRCCRQFVLGFLAASVIGTLYVAAVGSSAARPVIAA
jgi:hypothetical protein